MYTVLIVEDEILVNVGVQNMIRWSDLDMMIVGVGQNGEEGMKLYYEKRPDIILTDIKMPVMTGLEMIAQIREKDEVTKIIVLSAYNDFEFVRQAFRFGISDYILKMKMMPEDLEKILRKVQKELLQIPAEKLEKKDIKTERMTALEICREYILHSSYSFEEFKSQAEYLGLKQEGLIVGSVEFFAPKKQASEKNGRGKMVGIVLELIQTLLSEKNNGIVMQESENRYLLIMNFADTENPKERQKQLDELLQRILLRIKTYINVKPVIGVSVFAEFYEMLHSLYLQAYAIEKEAVFWGEELLFYHKERRQRRYEKTLSEVVQMFKQTDWLNDTCRQKILREIEIVGREEDMDVEVMKEYMSRWLHRISFESLIQKENSRKLVLETTKQIRSADTLSGMMEIFRSCLENMANADRQQLKSIEIARTVQYITENYYKEGISLTQAASFVGMNKEYLSSIFKREIGEGFVDYVNRMRINKACELLERGSLKISEISQVLGFRDESYFSRVFKKMMNMSPNEYRQAERNFCSSSESRG